MQRWTGRVAVVTGAGSGIGAAIAKQLVENNMTVVALDLRADKIPQATGVPKSEIKAGVSAKDQAGKMFTVQCDVTKESDVISAFQWVKEKLGGVDVLVNNAGVIGDSPITEAETDEWRRMLEVNVLGLSMCTREAVKIMRENDVQDGHIVQIGSIVGHRPPAVTNAAMYHASKHAVRALVEGLRKDLVAAGSRTRVSCISPSLVKTGLLDNCKIFSKEVMDTAPCLEAKDVADAVIYALGAPAHVQIYDQIILPVGE